MFFFYLFAFSFIFFMVLQLFIDPALHPLVYLFFICLPAFLGIILSVISVFREQNLSWKYLVLIPFAVISVLTNIIL